MRLRFTGWRLFKAGLDEKEMQRWLETVARISAQHMREKITGPHTGKIGYRKGGGRFIRSAPGEFPANDSGELLASVKGVAFKNKAFVAANTPHSTYLRKGTRRMAKRKMTIEALAYGIRASSHLRDGFIEWLRTRNR